MGRKAKSTRIEIEIDADEIESSVGPTPKLRVRPGLRIESKARPGSLTTLKPNYPFGASAPGGRRGGGARNFVNLSVRLIKGYCREPAPATCRRGHVLLAVVYDPVTIAGVRAVALAARGGAAGPRARGGRVRGRGGRQRSPLGWAMGGTQRLAAVAAVSHARHYYNQTQSQVLQSESFHYNVNIFFVRELDSRHFTTEAQTFLSLRGILIFRPGARLISIGSRRDGMGSGSVGECSGRADRKYVVTSLRPQRGCTFPSPAMPLAERPDILVIFLQLNEFFITDHSRDYCGIAHQRPEVSEVSEVPEVPTRR
ncbi:hypothetical protein EVAR_83297_1 [Eumeta japonica]|uniref:Uncharacterized protein n=1 Tax=Eumeta variegata TaxID=151549 RepID=A0A4C2A868_EUMVA|nr:hypothetical protein EVAR_83297_1 [Eumeta japonica]